jgi:hypothetical protein
MDIWAATSAIATGAAAVVTIIAAALAFWQARIAIGARNATVEQAPSHVTLEASACPAVLRPTLQCAAVLLQIDRGS